MMPVHVLPAADRCPPLSNVNAVLKATKSPHPCPNPGQVYRLSEHFCYFVILLLWLPVQSLPRFLVSRAPRRFFSLRFLFSQHKPPPPQTQVVPAYSKFRSNNRCPGAAAGNTADRS